MKAKVAVATVSGKAYFLLVNELKSRNIQFISVIPWNAIPAEAKVVITTRKEKHLVENDRVLVFEPENEPSGVVEHAVRILQGKENYEKVVIGIDPGDVFGLAVIADGKVAETCSCFNSAEVINTVKNLVKNIDVKQTAVIIRIGNGVPAHRELLGDLNSELPKCVTLEVVSEVGTNRPFIAHRRGLRDITSATRIAGRRGHVYLRTTFNE